MGQALGEITDPVDRAAIKTMHADLANRVDSKLPVRACDNEQTWAKAWRSWPTVTSEALAYDQLTAKLRFADVMAAIAAASAAPQA